MLSYIHMYMYIVQLNGYRDSLYMYVIFNPRRACAARVTVGHIPVCLSVCLSVCYHASEGIARFYANKEIPTALV